MLIMFISLSYVIMLNIAYSIYKMFVALFFFVHIDELLFGPNFTSQYIVLFDLYNGLTAF